MSFKKLDLFVKIVVVFVLVFGLFSFFALCPFVYFSEVEKTTAHNYLEDASFYYLNVYDFLVFQRELSSDFTESEASHMRDVRVLFNVFRLLSLLFVVFLIFYLFYLFKIKNDFLLKNFFNSLFSGAVISFFVVVFILFFSLVNFGFSFNVFHYVFFPQGNWLFPFDSLLITLFPQEFFFGISKKLFFISVCVISFFGFVFYYFKELFSRGKKRKKVILRR